MGPVLAHVGPVLDGAVGHVQGIAAEGAGDEIIAVPQIFHIENAGSLLLAAGDAQLHVPLGLKGVACHLQVLVLVGLALEPVVAGGQIGHDGLLSRLRRGELDEAEILGSSPVRRVDDEGRSVLVGAALHRKRLFGFHGHDVVVAGLAALHQVPVGRTGVFGLLDGDLGPVGPPVPGKGQIAAGIDGLKDIGPVIAAPDIEELPVALVHDLDLGGASLDPGLHGADDLVGPDLGVDEIITCRQVLRRRGRDSGGSCCSQNTGGSEQSQKKNKER